MKCHHQVVIELFTPQDRTEMYQDNIGTIKWMERDAVKHFTRQKHIDTRHQFDIDTVIDKYIRLRKLVPEDMLPNAFDKIDRYITISASIMQAEPICNMIINHLCTSKRPL